MTGKTMRCCKGNFEVVRIAGLSVIKRCSKYPTIEVLFQMCPGCRKFVFTLDEDEIAIFRALGTEDELDESWAENMAHMYREWFDEDPIRVYELTPRAADEVRRAREYLEEHELYAWQFEFGLSESA